MRGLLGLVLLVLNIIAIIDCGKSEKKLGEKILWIILILILPLVGLILYHLLGRKK